MRRTERRKTVTLLTDNKLCNPSRCFSLIILLKIFPSSSLPASSIVKTPWGASERDKYVKDALLIMVNHYIGDDIWAQLMMFGKLLDCRYYHW